MRFKAKYFTIYQNIHTHIHTYINVHTYIHIYIHTKQYIVSSSVNTAILALFVWHGNILNLKENDLIFLILFFQFYTRENFSCIKGRNF